MPKTIKRHLNLLNIDSLFYFTVMLKQIRAPIRQRILFRERRVNSKRHFQNITKNNTRHKTDRGMIQPVCYLLLPLAVSVHKRYYNCQDSRARLYQENVKL